MEHQLRVTGNKRTPDGKVPEYHVNGVDFDGFAYTGQPTTPTLVDAKNGYAFLQNPKRNPKAVESIVKSAQKQIEAADEAGASVTWTISTKAGADALRKLFADREISVTMIFQP